MRGATLEPSSAQGRGGSPSRFSTSCRIQQESELLRKRVRYPD
jgi:hypothetical protein